MFDYQCFILYIRLSNELQRGIPKKAIESKKNEEPTPIFRSFRGVMAPICCSDWLNQMQLCIIISTQLQSDATFSIIAGLLFTNLHQ